MTLNGDVWTATVRMVDSDEFKICSLNDAWDIELQYYDEVAKKWKDSDNTKVGDKTEFNFECNDGEHYRWTPDSIPAGHGTFVVNAFYYFVPGDKLIFTGNFAENAWADSNREMVYDDQTDTWSWEGDYPKDFEYKVFVVTATLGTKIWSSGSNVIFDGVHFEHTFDFDIDPD